MQMPGYPDLEISEPFARYSPPEIALEDGEVGVLEISEPFARYSPLANCVPKGNAAGKSLEISEPFARYSPEDPETNLMVGKT